MKNITKIVAIGLMTVSLLALSACNASKVADRSNGKLMIVSNNIDLKEIPIFGGKVNADFTVRNDGDEPVAILQGETSCMCTEAVVKGKDGFESGKIVMRGHGSARSINYTIQPGEEAVVTAIFDPMAHGPNATGPVRRDVYIKTNSTETPQLKFSFQGNVTKN